MYRKRSQRFFLLLVPEKKSFFGKIEHYLSNFRISVRNFVDEN